MSEPEGLTPAERELEEALQSLAPAPARVDPLGAAFEAGRRSAGRQVQLWRTAAAAALLVGVGGWLIPSSRVEPDSRSAAPVVVHSQPPTLSPPLAAQSLVMLQAAVREYGLAGLPPTHLPVVENRHPRGVL